MADVEALLNNVSFHAVTRYVQRVLGVTVNNPAFSTSAKMVAAAHAAAAGRGIDDIRREILSPNVVDAILVGLTFLRTSRLCVFIDQPSGVIVTVTEPRRRGRTGKRAKLATRREAHRQAGASARRNRRRPSPGIPPAREPAE